MVFPLAAIGAISAVTGLKAATIAAGLPLAIKIGTVGTAVGKGIASVIAAREAARTVLAPHTRGLVGRTIGAKFGEGLFKSREAKQIGATLGAIQGQRILGFKNGGRIKKSGKALLHKGEFVVSKRSKVTKKQKSVVRKNKKK